MAHLSRAAAVRTPRPNVSESKPPRVLAPTAPCACEKCFSACLDNPGLFLPGEAERAMARHGFGPEKLETVTRGSRGGLAGALFGDRIGNEGIAPRTNEHGCVFLDAEGKCTIHESKPAECRAYRHDDASRTINKRGRAIAYAWSTREARKEVARVGAGRADDSRITIDYALPKDDGLDAEF